MNITWDKSKEIGIQPIDEQHKEFFNIIDQIFSARQKKEVTKAKLSSLIYQLAGYAQYHFSVEEQYCEEYAYPGITAQINAHKQYQSDIMQIMHKMQDPRVDIEMLSEEVASFSMNWLTRHIMSEDKKIGEWYKHHKKLES